jgi:hypothetical protein
MGHLFYYDLGTLFPGFRFGEQDHITLSGQLLTGLEERYWSGTRSFVRPSDGLSAVWYFRFTDGDTIVADERSGHHTWFAAAGDIAGAQDPPVPEPATVLLMLFGLGAGGLEWSRRNRRSSLRDPGHSARRHEFR